MSYVTEHITSTLKTARKTKGFSQRELSKRAGVPQSHISKIENGTVDLRLSSLVALARILDLELMLVPRKTVSAVQSIVRQAAQSTPTDSKAERHAWKNLTRLQEAINNLPADRLPQDERRRIRRYIRELHHFRISKVDAEAIRDAYRAVQAFSRDRENINAFRNAFSQLRALRNALVHGVGTTEPDSVRPAYSLDNDDDG